MGVDVNFIWRAVVIGNEINAIRFAAKNKAKILFNCFPSTHSYEPLSNPGDRFLEDEWAKHSYGLYCEGLNPFADKIKLIRVFEEEKTLHVILKSERVYKIKYNDLYLFDLENVFGLEEYFERRVLGYKVLDWFDIRLGGAQQFSDVRDKDSNFVKKVTFFKSTRLDGTRSNVDLVAESFLSKEQLNNPDYTDTMAKFKIYSMLQDKDFTIESWKRDVYPIKETIYINEFGDFFWMPDISGDQNENF